MCYASALEKCAQALNFYIYRSPVIRCDMQQYTPKPNQHFITDSSTPAARVQEEH